jgi:hypothetical protein
MMLLLRRSTSTSHFLNFQFFRHSTSQETLRLEYVAKPAILTGILMSVKLGVPLGRCLITNRPDDGGIKHLRNASQILQDYTLQCPRRLSSSVRKEINYKNNTYHNLCSVSMLLSRCA